jgi:hypothetical protein
MGLLEKAKKVMDVRGPGSPSFRLSEYFRFWLKKDGWIEGSYTMLWANPEHWRDEFTLAGYPEIRVGGQGVIWRLRNSQFRRMASQQARSISSDWSRLLKTRPDDRVERIHDQRDGQLVTKCVALKSKDGWSERDLCFDENQG